jgi:hypothetical protein
VSVEPFVALMRRYCIDYTNSHDQSVCDEIMEPEYVAHLRLRPARRGVQARGHGRVRALPRLQLQVHEFVTNGERLAMRFSEHGAAVDVDGRMAAWGGIGLYRWNGRKLLSRTSSSRTSRPGDAARERRVRADREPARRSLGRHARGAGERGVRGGRAALAREGRPARRRERGDRRLVVAEAPAESPLEVESVAVTDLFSAGARVAFHVIQRGRYRGGLPGVDARLVGREATLRCVGLARVEAGEVRGVRAITDRLGTRRALLASAG